MKVYLASLFILLSVVCLSAQSNKDGSTVSINGVTITSMSGTIDTTTKFDVYMPSETVKSAVSLVVKGIKSKDNTSMYVRGVEHKIIYTKTTKMYTFNTVEYSSVSDVKKAVREWLYATLLK